jgi:ABC-type phosphate transport system permease subunit
LIDPTDWFDTPKGIVLGLLRALWWLAWEICVQTVGWSMGWCVLRLLTLGHYPEERLGGVDDASTGTAFLVEGVGLVALALGIWGLTGALP